MEISARGRTSSRRRSPNVAKLKDTNGGGGNGHATSDFDLKQLLRALQAMRDGDFTVRLAPDQSILLGGDRVVDEEAVNRTCA